ncbi:hypothetical protein DRJ00_02750 [Candidatus Aerophobetes bacterium]|uniref:Na+-translocating membrane potential-generating system MpsC domain-containing protein n=1 Tax=Aerophobetes bacterium TaxID=2030807 RepID=A0A497E7I3_UNCAE|nr:MAG: hypothetical protein DRJ00_02750 [Candidatus Aerophobetes bacterium]
MKKKTRGQIEAKISETMIKFEKEFMGRGPEEAKTWIFKDLILVRLRGVLTPAEERLTKTPQGRELIKKVRRELVENARCLLEKIIFDITQVKVKSLHTDISTKSGERIIVFTLEENLEEKLTNA